MSSFPARFVRSGLACALAAGATALLGSCNQYELFLLTGYEQESFSNKADVIFVIDNSDSMYETSASLATNFASFINELQTVEDERPSDGLADAADNYIDYVQNRSSFVDFQFAITTTDVDADQGRSLGPLIRRGDPDIASSFVETLLCEATCFRKDLVLPSDPDYVCGQALQGEVTEDYMDCVCGAGSWRGNCGASVEEGLEAAYLAMCSAVPSPPLECLADVVQPATATDEEPNTIPAVFTETDILANEGMLRDRANTIVVVVSDEGDGSRRMERQATGEEYEKLFEQFGRRVTFATIVPGLGSDDKVTCPGTATDWGVSRYTYMANRTGGIVEDIFDPACDPRDFSEALNSLGELLRNLLTTFPLRSIPDPDTIVVFVEGKEIAAAEVTGQDRYGFDVFGDGWSYDIGNNAVEFHGAAVPPYDAEVDVYYLPLEGMPRDLPFGN